MQGRPRTGAKPALISLSQAIVPLTQIPMYLYISFAKREENYVIQQKNDRIFPVS